MTKEEEYKKLPILRKLIVEHFNQNDLEVLCFDLGISFEDIPNHHGPLDNLTINLILYCKRRNLLQTLVEGCRKHRESVNWPDILPQSQSQIENYPSNTNNFIVVFDPDQLFTTTTVCAWLSNSFVPGDINRFHSVSAGLGEEFVMQIYQIWQVIIKNNPDIVQQLHGVNFDTKQKLLYEIISENPFMQPNISKEQLRVALSKLLLNPHYFTNEDVDMLCLTLGYNPTDFYKIGWPYKTLLTNFLFQIEADGKLPKLIREIHALKGYRLFEN